MRHLYNYGYYGPNSVTWKVAREVAILLGGSRAVLNPHSGELRTSQAANTANLRYNSDAAD